MLVFPGFGLARASSLLWFVQGDDTDGLSK
jgi:hypothetical protein